MCSEEMAAVWARGVSPEGEKTPWRKRFVQLHTKETTEMPLQLESSDAKLGSSVSDSVLITVDITKFIYFK